MLQKCLYKGFKYSGVIETMGVRIMALAEEFLYQISLFLFCSKNFATRRGEYRALKNYINMQKG